MKSTRSFTLLAAGENINKLISVKTNPALTRVKNNVAFQIVVNSGYCSIGVILARIRANTLIRLSGMGALISQVYSKRTFKRTNVDHLKAEEKLPLRFKQTNKNNINNFNNISLPTAQTMEITMSYQSQGLI